MTDTDHLATIAKELRMAQATVTGFARFLAAGETDQARRHCISSILDAAHAIETATERLREMTRDEAPSPVPSPNGPAGDDAAWDEPT